MGLFDVFFKDNSNSNKVLLEKGELYDIKKIKEAIKEGGNVDAEIKKKYSGESIKLIHLAVMAGSKSLLNLLLDKGADINNNNIAGKTPLHTAIILNDIKLAKLLIFRKANINIKDNEGKTPLHYAVEKANYPLVLELLKSGATVNMQDVMGKTPLHYVHEKSGIDIVCALLNKDTSILNIQDLNGQTALHVSITNPSVIAALMAFGADNKIIDKNGNTPLDIINNVIQLCGQSIQTYHSFKKLDVDKVETSKEVEKNVEVFHLLENCILASKIVLTKYEVAEDQRESILGIPSIMEMVKEAAVEGNSQLVPEDFFETL